MKWRGGILERQTQSYGQLPLKGSSFKAGWYFRKTNSVLRTTPLKREQFYRKNSPPKLGGVP